MSPLLWIERYRRAWETADAGEIVALFTPDASYRSSVFREPYVGSDAIHGYWLRGAGTQREVAVRMGQPIISPDRVAVEWWTTMIDPDDGEITLPGCLLLRFAPDGRCQDLWEYARQARPARRLGRLTTPTATSPLGLPATRHALTAWAGLVTRFRWLGGRIPGCCAAGG
jgi:hypothetical protein